MARYPFHLPIDLINKRFVTVAQKLSTELIKLMHKIVVCLASIIT